MAPSGQSGGFYLHLCTVWGSHWASFCESKDFPEAVAAAMRHPNLAGDGRAPGNHSEPTSLSGISQCPLSQPATWWDQWSVSYLQPSLSLVLRPWLRSLASCVVVVPEPKMPLTFYDLLQVRGHNQRLKLRWAEPRNLFFLTQL